VNGHRPTEDDQEYDVEGQGGEEEMGGYGQHVAHDRSGYQLPEQAVPTSMFEAVQISRIHQPPQLTAINQQPDEKLRQQHYYDQQWYWIQQQFPSHDQASEMNQQQYYDQQFPGLQQQNPPGPDQPSEMKQQHYYDDQLFHGIQQQHSPGPDQPNEMKQQHYYDQQLQGLQQQHPHGPDQPNEMKQQHYYDQQLQGLQQQRPRLFPISRQQSFVHLEHGQRKPFTAFAAIRI
jgi:hypothetical protein